MASVDVQVASEKYFASLNSLTKRLWQERDNLQKSCGTVWNELPAEEQEQLFQQHLVDESVQKKYENVEREDVPEVFPKLRINCGEKIVVDFENEDGWTWRDEHSGPFSWMTKSQQNLTLDDLDQLDNKDDKGGKVSRGKSHSPEREGNSNAVVKGDKSLWEASYAAAEKTKNIEAASTADEIFQKFGIAFSFGTVGDEQDETAKSLQHSEEVESPREETKLLPGGRSEFDNVNFVLDDVEDGVPSQRVSYTDSSSYSTQGTEDVLVERAPSLDLSSNQDSSGLSASTEMMEKKLAAKHAGKMKIPLRSDRPEAERALMSDIVAGIFQEVDSVIDRDYGEQVSPVFVADAGESSSDALGSSPFDFLPRNSAIRASTDREDTDSKEPQGAMCADVSEDRYLGQDQPLDEDTSRGHDTMAADTKDTEDDNMVKSGFDFLDDW